MLRLIISRWNDFMTESRDRVARDVGSLILRVGLGSAMMLNHGLGKLQSFSEKSGGFPDPLGVGSPMSMALAVFAEFFCSAAIIVGFATRLALTQLIATMAVAFFIIHGADPFSKKEMAFLYLVPFIALFLLGPGRISVDGWLSGIYSKSKA